MHLLYRRAIFGGASQTSEESVHHAATWLGFVWARSPPGFRNSLLGVLQPQDALDDECQEQDYARRDRHSPRDVRVDRTGYPPE